MKAGDELGLTFAYAVPAGTAAPVTGAAKQASSDGTTLAIILGAIALIAIAVVLVSRRKPQPVASVEAADSVDEASAEELTDEASSDEESGEPVTASPGSSKRTLVTVAIIGALILGVVIAGGQSAKPKSAGAGGAITQSFAGGDPCANASIALAVPADADPAATAESLFGAIKTIEGLTSATYDPKTSTIQIGYCDSTSSEAALKEALAPTGLVAP